MHMQNVFWVHPSNADAPSTFHNSGSACRHRVSDCNCTSFLPQVCEPPGLPSCSPSTSLTKAQRVAPCSNVSRHRCTPKTLPAFGLGDFWKNLFQKCDLIRHIVGGCTEDLPPRPSFRSRRLLKGGRGGTSSRHPSKMGSMMSPF